MVFGGSKQSFMPKIKIIDRVRFCIKPGHSTEQRKYKTWSKFKLDKNTTAKGQRFSPGSPSTARKNRNPVSESKKILSWSVHFRKKTITGMQKMPVYRRNEDQNLRKKCQIPQGTFSWAIMALLSLTICIIVEKCHSMQSIRVKYAVLWDRFELSLPHRETRERVSQAARARS